MVVALSTACELATLGMSALRLAEHRPPAAGPDPAAHDRQSVWLTTVVMLFRLLRCGRIPTA